MAPTLKMCAPASSMWLPSSFTLLRCLQGSMLKTSSRCAPGLRYTLWKSSSCFNGAPLTPARGGDENRSTWWFPPLSPKFCTMTLTVNMEFLQVPVLREKVATIPTQALALWCLISSHGLQENKCRFFLLTALYAFYFWTFPTMMTFRFYKDLFLCRISTTSMFLFQDQHKISHQIWAIRFGHFCPHNP
jgi:hypothetical protein